MHTTSIDLYPSPFPRQMSKKMSFFQLRDSYGATQLIADVRTCGEEVLNAMRKIPNESTVMVEGTVRVRPKSQRRDVRMVQYLRKTSLVETILIP